MFRLPRAAVMGGAMARAAARPPDRGPRRIRSAQRPAQQCPTAHTSWYSSLASSRLAVLSEYSVQLLEQVGADQPRVNPGTTGGRITIYQTADGKSHSIAKRDLQSLPECDSGCSPSVPDVERIHDDVGFAMRRHGIRGGAGHLNHQRVATRGQAT